MRHLWDLNAVIKYALKSELKCRNSRKCGHSRSGEAVGERQREERTSFVLILLQRITTNLCLGRSSPSTHSPIGSGLISMPTYPTNALSLAPPSSVVYGNMCARVRPLFTSKNSVLLPKHKRCREGKLPVCAGAPLSGLLMLHALERD